MKKNQGTTQAVMAHVTIGIQLAITVLLGVLGGNWLDNRFKTSPLFLAICTAVAMIVGFYHLMKQLSGTGANVEAKPEEKRKKWN
ncbi:MAG: AtpZ/AtpI family protein [Spirochaetes bacterium]|nr:AtpZ/AtpI family protein [Spirochaetota bacterium]